MPRFFKKSQRYNVARNCFLAKVVLLDNTTIEFNLLPEVTGTDCLEKVSQVMEIQEISYFGLQYQSKSEYLRWVDRDKPLRKQLEKNCINGARDAELRFRVQFYVTNVTRLDYEISRYLYFLQLKGLVLNGDLQCSNDIAVKLASYALQAEFGDYDADKHGDEFLNDYIFLPPHIGPPSVVKSLTDKASKFHMRHAGMSPAAAEMMYIKLAQQLPEYGHEAFQVLDIHGSTIWIGACFIGIYVKHSNGQPNIYFKWPDIYRMKVKDKNFGIETPGETVYFKMPDNHTSQYVLQQMALQHKFYRSEMEGNPAISWLVSDNRGSKKKSRSIHDLRSPKADRSDYRGRASTLVAREVRSLKDNHRIHRPLMEAYGGRVSEQKHHIDGSSVSSPVQIISVTGDKSLVKESSFSPEPANQTELSPAHQPSSSASPSHQAPPTSNTNTTPFTTTADSSNRTEENHSNATTGPSASPDHKQSKKLFGRIMPNSKDPAHSVHRKGASNDLDDQERRFSDPHSNSTSGGSTPKGSPGRIKKIKINGFPKSGRSSFGEGDEDLIQDTVDLTNNKRKRITGSLDNLDSKTPPYSHKTRTFSIAEQEEQEAASGTRDRRGGQLERRLSTGHYFNEYEQLPRKRFNADTKTGELPENVPRNRYKDIVPYEDNRVRLNPANNTGRNDYINASRVSFTVNENKRNFLVAQGPMEHTCADFWQMIWEQKIQLVLMVTNELEDHKSKCFRYFPSDDSDNDKPSYIQFEQYRVSRLFVEKGPSVISRGFQLKHIPSGAERKITHLQYIDWPDHGIPENPQPFLDFLAEVRSLRQRYDPTLPVVVHCSAGVGRSGVVVLMDMLMAKVDCGDILDVSRCLKELRQQRMHMVQVVGQYKFVYTAIIKYIGRARLI